MISDFVVDDLRSTYSMDNISLPFEIVHAVGFAKGTRSETLEKRKAIVHDAQNCASERLLRAAIEKSSQLFAAREISDLDFYCGGFLPKEMQ